VYCRVRLQNLPERAALEQAPVVPVVPVPVVPVPVVPVSVVPALVVPALVVPALVVPALVVPVSAVLALAVAPAVPVMWAAQPGLYLRVGLYLLAELNLRARSQVLNLKQLHLARRRYSRPWSRCRTLRGAARN
jgi:hypothetical protein